MVVVGWEETGGVPPSDIPPAAFPLPTAQKNTWGSDMARVEFELDVNGLRELMKSGEMQAVLQEAGDSVASGAGGDYGVRVHVADYVAIANIYPDSKEAAKDNYENNTLLKALGSAGLNMRK